MDLETRLRAHLGEAADTLQAPPPTLEGVIRRGRRRRAVQRAGVAAGIVAALALVPAVLQLADRSVELQPADPPPAPEQTADPGEAPADPVPVSALGAPVLVAGENGLRLVDGTTEQVLWPDPVTAAFPDRRGGVVLQPRDAPHVVWLPDAVRPGEPGAPVNIASTRDAEMLLRGLLPDGRVLYSVRQHSESLAEGDDEVFLATELDPHGAAEVVDRASAYESWTIGPVTVADSRMVAASCHLHCQLWPWLEPQDIDAEPLYRGFAIEGLTATRDGSILAFVEHDPVDPERAGRSELVLFDGASFTELARIPLPVDDPGAAMVSMTDGGRRILVSLGVVLPDGSRPAPTSPFLVEDVLTGEPRIRPVGAEGFLVWAGPDQS